MTSKFDIPLHFQNWNKSSSRSSKASDRQIAQKPLYKRPWVILVFILVLIAIIIAIVVPLAVILPRKKKHIYHSSVMLPLYIYPQDNGTWAPLYDSLQANPHLNFTVIINPASGPGNNSLPDQSYVSAIRQLKTYPNVEAVGYVRTGYATRNLSDVVSEVKVYAGWASQNEVLAVKGIFFDESPHQYSEDAVQFMLDATRAVKDEQGIQGHKTVIRNPGVIPDPRFADSNTDVNVIFEQSYSEYLTKKSDLNGLDNDRLHHCYMVHSMPAMTQAQMGTFLQDTSRKVEYLFVTENDADYYEKFGDDWDKFTAVLAM